MAGAKKPKKKCINLALQGGGSHGAFTWGVLDQLLGDGRLEIEAISATSAGAINAVVMASGLLEGGPARARELLEEFWRRVGALAALSPLQPTPFDRLMGTGNLDSSPPFVALDVMSRLFSPYDLNVFNLNPLRDIVEEMVNFKELRKNHHLKLFINATQVRTGKARVFTTKELSLDVVMASACLPFLFQAVEVDGEPYWDGGYSGNPPIFPLIYNCVTTDVMLVQINPLVIPRTPTGAPAILDRLNEISFNANLMGEMRAIAFVQKLLKKNHVSPDEYKYMRLHMIEAHQLLESAGSLSKMSADRDFLVKLHDGGAEAAAQWMKKHYAKIGIESSIDIRKTFL